MAVHLTLFSFKCSIFLHQNNPDICPLPFEQCPGISVRVVGVNNSFCNLGARLLQFSGPQAYATTTGGISISWPSIDEDNQQFHSSLKKAFSGINKQFPFLLASNPEKGIQGNPEVSISQKLVNTNSSSESNCGHLLLSNKWTHLEESKRALSLLSTRQTLTPEKSMSPLKQQDTIHLNHPTGTSLQFNELAPYSNPQAMEDKALGAVLNPDTSNIYEHRDGIIHVGSEELLETRASQLLSFSWK